MPLQLALLGRNAQDTMKNVCLSPAIIPAPAGLSRPPQVASKPASPARIVGLEEPPMRGVAGEGLLGPVGVTRHAVERQRRHVAVHRCGTCESIRSSGDRRPRGAAWVP